MYVKTEKFAAIWELSLRSNRAMPSFWCENDFYNVSLSREIWKKIIFLIIHLYRENRTLINITNSLFKNIPPLSPKIYLPVAFIDSVSMETWRSMTAYVFPHNSIYHHLNTLNGKIIITDKIITFYVISWTVHAFWLVITYNL